MESRGYIHAIPKKIVALNHDIAEIYADAKLHPAIIGLINIPIFQLPLNVGRTIYCLDWACELGDYAVTSAAENTTMVAFNKLVDNLAACSQGVDRCFLVGLHEPAIADHIGRQNRREPAFDTVPCHGSAP